MAVNSSTLEGKYNGLRRVGGKSNVINSAIKRCENISRDSGGFTGSNDIAEYINPRGTALEFERETSRAVSRLTILRNVLTLAPLTLTWIGFLTISQEKGLELTKALSAFIPFAWGDIFCFVVLIVIGLAADAKANTARQNALKVHEILDSIVTELTRKVAAPIVDSANVQEWQRLVHKQLQDVRDVLAKVSAEIQTASATTREVATQMLALQQAAVALGLEASTLSGAVSKIGASASEMAKSAQGMDASSKTLTAATAAAAAAQDATNRKMDVVVQDLDRTSRAIEAAAASEAAIPRKLDQLDGNLQKATGSLAKTTTYIEQIERRLINVVRVAGGTHGPLWYIFPWHWGRGRTVLAPQQTQQPQWQQHASPPPGQTPPTPQNMPGPGNFNP